VTNAREARSDGTAAAADAAEREATPAPARRVLFITQYFPPETGAAPARAAHFARALVRAGHHVRVVTGIPNHPSGRIAAGYELTRRATEAQDGLQVERVWLHATPHRTAWTRLWNHLTFAVSALGVALSGPRPDVVLASTPPLFLGVTAWLAALRHRAPLVLDCRDDWPTAAVALGELREGMATRALAALARFLQRRAARVIAVTPGMLRQFERRGLDPTRLELVTNGADTDLFQPSDRTHGGPAVSEPQEGSLAPFTVLYAGTHGLVHGMEVLLDAARQLQGEPRIRFLFVGDGVAKPMLEARAAQERLERVEFRPSVPPTELVTLIRAADVCVATTRDHPFCGETIPVKLFDYLACGRPVVAAVRGDAAAVLAASGAGLVVEPGDGAGLAAALRILVSDPGRCRALAAAGPPFVERHYSRRALGERLAGTLETVVRRARGRDIPTRPTGFHRALKRSVDVLVSLALLVLLAPLFLAVAILIRLDSPGPAFFRQRRVGRATSEFVIVKFRTMRLGTPDLASHLVGPGSSHITSIGRMLRRTSLDELPQLINVLRGEMTLIGPRPALHNQNDLIALRQEAGVDALVPGVTGWAQIHGRDDLPIALKVRYDRHYLEHLSPWLDLLIALRTPFALFSSRGVY
jgi:lipopolysaccharide/colanic/teichoic acid biosynthesis glycosyltransferase/glycosyltransferase involved in cell wall biosynthesis